MENINIRHLYIIGNGFDMTHGYETSYDNFRKYLISRFQISEENYALVPESYTLPDGGEEYDEKEMAGFIARILDECGDENWGNLEDYLGSSVIDSLISELDLLDKDDDSEKDLRHGFYNNEDRSEHMKNVFPRVKDYFCDWIMDYYRGLPYDKDGKLSDGSSRWKQGIATILKEGDGFLTFNYTMTLERLYGIDENNICHIHGKVGDKNEDIFFGHGEDDGVKESFEIMGAESNLSFLKYSLYKDTAKAWSRHADFFDRIGTDLIDIHSFGFSFSGVDFYYVQRLAEKVDATKVTWYINQHADLERRNGTINGRYLAAQLKKVEDLGFEVVVDGRW